MSLPPANYTVIAMKRITLLVALFVMVAAVAPAASAQLRRAERALSDLNYEEAHAIVEAYIAEKPEEHRAYELLARLHKAQADTTDWEVYLVHTEGMAAAYRKVLELRPRDPGQVGRELLLAYQNAFMGGVDAFNEAQAVADDASREMLFMQASYQFQAAALVMPDSLDPHLNWAFAAISGGDQERAIGPLKKALEMGQPEIDWYVYLGRIYITSERVEEAVDVLEEGVETFGDNEDLQSLLLAAYAETGQHDRAIERYRDRAVAMPDDRITRYNLGSLLLQSEQYDEAIEHLQAAVGIDSTHIDSHYNLGAAYINKATEVQEEAVALDEALRAQRDSLSQEEIDARQEEIFAVEDIKRGLMAEAIPYLERARELAVATGNDPSATCRALYQAYAQTDQMEKLAGVEACAGY